MWRSKPDPLLQELRDQIAYLREQVATKELRIQELERHIIALSQPSAYNRIYQKQEESTDEILPPPVISPRRISPYKVKDDHFWDNVERTFAKNVAEYEKAQAPTEDN